MKTHSAARGQLTTTARAFQVTKTALQYKVDFVVRLQTPVVATINVIILAASLLEGLSTVRLVQAAAVLNYFTAAFGKLCSCGSLAGTSRMHRKPLL